MNPITDLVYLEKILGDSGSIMIIVSRPLPMRRSLTTIYVLYFDVVSINIFEVPSIQKIDTSKHKSVNNSFAFIF